MKGFMLMELLVTLALLAVLAPSLLGFINMGTETLAFAQQHTVAVCLAQESVENIKASDFCSIMGSGPEAVDGFSGYTREVEIIEYGGDGRLPMKAARVTVRWQQGLRGHHVCMVAWQTWR